MFKTKNVKLETYDEKSFKLLEELVYEGNCGDHRIPEGYITDFASVPAMVQWLIPSYGKYALAAIVHDWYCERLNEGNSPISSRDVDGIFRRMMRELDVPFLRRWVMWTGVRWGAMFSNSRRPGIAPDLLKMIFWSVLSAPIVAPATLLAGIALFFDKVIHLAVGRFVK